VKPPLNYRIALWLYYHFQINPWQVHINSLGIVEIGGLYLPLLQSVPGNKDIRHQIRVFLPSKDKIEVR
jgi:hypothetical protein